VNSVLRAVVGAVPSRDWWLRCRVKGSVGAGQGARCTGRDALILASTSGCRCGSGNPRQVSSGGCVPSAPSLALPRQGRSASEAACSVLATASLRWRVRESVVSGLAPKRWRASHVCVQYLQHDLTH